MKLWRLIFLPLSLIYGIIVYIRNKLYEYKILHSTSFNIPIISVGNLCTGGSGKTPHVEYLIKLLSDKYNVAVLSRGYKRNTNNFIVANTSTQWQQIGDEPMQYFKKFNNIIVAVDRKRKNGIYNLIKLYKNLSVILLDDAYQHRQVKPGLSILLTDYYHPYYNDYLLPTGNLREPPSEAKRADIIIVTKCPEVLSPITIKSIKEKLKPTPHQQVYFSYIKYENICPVPGIKMPNLPPKIYSILLIAGIANTYPLEEYLKKICLEIEIIKFPDHHKFLNKDITFIFEKFHNIVTKNKILITTEKDLIRLEKHEMFNLLRELPFFYIPMQIEFHKNYKNQFDQKILNYVRKN